MILIQAPHEEENFYLFPINTSHRRSVTPQQHIIM